MCLKKQKNKKKGILPIFILLILLSSSVVNSVIQLQPYNAPTGIQLRFENVNITCGHLMNFSRIGIDAHYVLFNDTVIRVDSLNPVNITLNYLHSDILDVHALGTTLLNFTAKCSGGTVWFNISGYKPGMIYRLRKNNTVIGNFTANSSGYICFPIASWSSGFITCSLAGSTFGSGLRSDGSYLYRTMENGVLPSIWLLNPADSLDTNSTLEGKYCYNITGGPSLTRYINLSNYSSLTLIGLDGIKPTGFSYKFRVYSIHNSIKFIVTSTIGMGTTDTLFFGIASNKTFYISSYNGASSAIQYFSGRKLELNTTYTVTYNNIVYGPVYKYGAGAFDYLTGWTADSITISNTTSSSSISNVRCDLNSGTAATVGQRPAMARLSITRYNTSDVVYVDDWIVGTQTNVTTGVSSVQHEYNASITGLLVNDGSPLQNNSQHDHNISVLYDTDSSQIASYTYYFNETNSSEQLAVNPYYMNDSSNITFSESYGKFNDKLIERQNTSTWFLDASLQTNSEMQGQVFTIGTTGKNASFIPTKISLKIRLLNIPINGITIQLKNTTVSHKPGTVTFGTSFLPAASIVDAAWNDFILNSTSMVMKGEEYCVIANSSDNAFNHYYTYYADNAYSNGGRLHSHNGGVTWTYDTTDDLSFRLYGNSSGEQLLINHTGNTSTTPSGDISKVELLLLGNVSSDAYGGRIMVQPVFNNTNGSYYDTFMHYGVSSSWSDPIDVTNDGSAPASWSWPALKRLQARISANITSGSAYINRVALRVSINLTKEYSDLNVLSSGYDTGDSLPEQLTGLTPGQLYYYRYYTGTNYTNSTSYSYGEEKYLLARPCAPTNTNTHVDGVNATYMNVNLTWTNGTGANRTVILYKTTGYPTGPTDGTLIVNSSTHPWTVFNMTAGTAYYITAYSFTNWTTPTISRYSDNGTRFLGGGIIIYSYDEATHANITFDVLVSNPDGSDTYINTSCTNPHTINASLTPHGQKIGFYVSSTGYRTRTYTLAIYDGIWYLLRAYLPRNTTNGTGDDCISKRYIDYFIITNPALDVWKTLTYDVDFIESVEVYNTSLKYWYDVNYTYYAANNTVNIDQSLLASNTTMAKITYYYLDCTNQTASYIYYFQVVTDPQGTTISNASIQIKKYINATGLFDTISNMYTDSNGIFNVYLLPNINYKIICNKEGYYEEIVDFIPNTLTFSHIIKMRLIDTIPQPPIIEPESIHFTGELGHFSGNSTYVLNLTYLDDSGYTNSTTLLIYAYNFSTNTSTLIATFTTTSNQSWTYRVYNIDRNMTYTCGLTYVHYYLGTQQRSYILEHQIWIPITPAEVDALFDWMGAIPFGALNLLMWFLFVAICYYADSRDIGKILIILGVIYMFLGVYIGLKTNLFGESSAIAGGVLPTLFILMGILIEWGQSKRRL